LPEKVALPCPVEDCPSFNDYANGCRLSQYDVADPRYMEPDNCAHRKFVLKDKT
jgi:hypothetical protein